MARVEILHKNSNRIHRMIKNTVMMIHTNMNMNLINKYELDIEYEYGYEHAEEYEL